MTLTVDGFHCDHGHIQAHYRLPNEQPLALGWCPGQNPALDAAAETFAAALVAAGELSLVESVPRAPDGVDGEALHPCRMCGTQRADNVTDSRGYTWCHEHREYARG